MALWQVVQRVPEVQALYGPHFPIEVRHYFSPWIEAQPWSAIDPSNEHHHSTCRQVLDILLSTLKSKVEDLASDPDQEMERIRLRLSEITTELTTLWVFSLDRREMEYTRARFLTPYLCFLSQVRLRCTAVRQAREAVPKCRVGPGAPPGPTGQDPCRRLGAPYGP